MRRNTTTALVLALAMVIGWAAPVHAQDGLLASATRLATEAAAEQADAIYVQPRSKVRMLGGVALAVAGAWTALSYYDQEPTKTCGLSGMVSNRRLFESDPIDPTAYSRYVTFPDRYEFTPIMVDDTCMLEAVYHDGGREYHYREDTGRDVWSLAPYSTTLRLPYERFRYDNSPQGYPHREWTWLDGEGAVEAVTTYGEVSRARLYGGLAMIGAGALLATLWADAPAPLSDLQVGVTPDGFRATRTVGW